MKLILAVVRPNVIDRLIVAFEDIEGFPGVTVMNTEGFGLRIKTPEDALNPFRPNRRLEIASPDDKVESIVAAIKEHGHTGRKGDGFIIVLDIESSTLI